MLRRRFSTPRDMYLSYLARTALSGPEYDRIRAVVQVKLDRHADDNMTSSGVWLVYKNRGASVHAIDG